MGTGIAQVAAAPGFKVTLIAAAGHAREQREQLQEIRREVQYYDFRLATCHGLFDHPKSGWSITTGIKEWPQHLSGFAARAHSFYEKQLRRSGFTLRAAIINFPDGKSGDVGFFLRW
jgi:hypothetical protein